MIRKLIFMTMIFAAPRAAFAAPMVQTKYGAVVGSETTDDYIFKGIPYAAPPIGALRFGATQEPAPWSQPFAATAYGNMCPQLDLVSKKTLGNEDCLKLNIWRPKTITKPLPVMVFIHGGGNTIGAGDNIVLGDNMYDGTDLSKNGVIVVTLNYRLGPMGFLAHKALETAHGQVGNYAILDALQALKFVQENIGVFGGDKNNVTVFGESSGAINILVMMASPKSTGLFQRVILESSFLNDHAKATAEASGGTFAKLVGCDTQPDVAACLRTLTADQLVKNYAASGPTLLVAAGATVDGVVLKQSVLQSIQSGEYQKVPVIIGNNSEEFRTLGPLVVPMTFIYTDADYRQALTQQFGAAAAAKIQAYYPTATYHHPRLALEAALTDYFALCPARTLTRRFVRDTPQTYRYIFSHEGQNPIMAILGAGHGMEVPYVFGGLTRYLYTPAEFSLSENMRTNWTAFAHDSDPNVAGQTQWPTAVGDTYLDFDLSSQVNENFHGDACDFWAQLGVGQGVIP